MIGFTGGLFLVTGVLAVFTFRLWRATQTLVRDAEVAARDTIAQMQRAEERELRAYVTAEGGTISNVFPAQLPVAAYIALLRMPTSTPLNNGFMQVEVTIKNSGKTPAYRVEHWANVQGSEYPLVSPLIPEGARSSGYMSRAIISPGGTNQKPITAVALTADQLTTLGAGTHAIYVYGEIRYRDAFGKDRWTRYRYLYAKRGSKL